jgi:predicted CXXCH cytochrome family protein
MNWIKRLFYGMLFAIPLMLMTYALVQASNSPQAAPPKDVQDCATCHPEFQTAWENGAHGNALNDPVFKEAWTAAGKPESCLECHVTGYDPVTKTWTADGITCAACHSPIPANHPQEPMPVEHSGKKCSDCHTETYFEWEVSAHRQKNIDCSSCHDPHQTTLVAADPDQLCGTCHQQRAENFTHSAHSQQGLTCDDCHMTPLSPTGQEGHAKRDHSFFVSLKSCNSCHAYDMHDPVSVHPQQVDPVEPPDAMVSVESSMVSTTPVQSNPIAFTLLAGLMGVVIGIAIAPSAEHLGKKIRRKDK